MESIVIIILALLALLVAMPIWALVKSFGQARTTESLEHRVGMLQQEIYDLRRQLREASVAPPPATVEKAATPPAVVIEQPAPAPVVQPTPTAASLPPPIPPVRPTAVQPPVITPPTPSPVYVPPEPAPARLRINWEHFMGAKLFAWLGGAALFLGVVFGVKYSFDHGWVPPELRVALGFLFGAGLIVAGLRLARGTRYTILSQSFCATGIVILYAVTFACRTIYKFEFFGLVPTFLLMALITAAAFVLAVRLQARVVAILGMLGGFLTPILLSTGVDNPGGLFGYIALLNIGLIAVALHRHWHFLVPLGAGSTVLMMLGWAERFFDADPSTKATAATIVCLGFCALFLGAYIVARRLQQSSREITFSAVALPFVSFGFALFFLTYPVVAARPMLLFTLVFLADAALLALAWLDDEIPTLHLIAGGVVFGILALWTGSRLTNDLLPFALAAYLLYAILHTAFPILLERRRPEAASTGWSQVFPPLALLLLILPLFKLDEVSLLLWPCILVIDLIAIGLALISASLVAVVAALVLTLVATGAWLFNVPTSVSPPMSLLLVVGAFAVLFFAAGIFLARRLGTALSANGANQTLPSVFGDARAQIPAFSALLPFVLLIMMTQRLALANPSPVFGLALLLIILTLGLAYVLNLEWLPACALVGVAALEYAWHGRLYAGGEMAGTALIWYFVFYGLFVIYPFIFQRRFTAVTGPWAIAALSGVAAFPLVYRVVSTAWPNEFLGLLPAMFAVTPLLSLVAILRTPADNPARLNQLAWFGGVALLFITLIIPVQFDKQWITVGWALEGAALLWLYHRIPHRGLQGTGVVLLVVAFARLLTDQAVIGHHISSGSPIFNWYFYTYTIAAASLLVGAYLLAPPRDQVLGLKPAPILNAFGLTLAFLLLNIEIAHYFTDAGHTVRTFAFSGSFARDMTVTIAWALFALGLLLLGIWKNTRAGRYAAIALLSVALLKLFFHDLARLPQLYRIGALFAVAVIAIIASSAYQRFLPGNEKTESSG